MPLLRCTGKIGRGRGNLREHRKVSSQSAGGIPSRSDVARTLALAAADQPCASTNLAGTWIAAAWRHATSALWWLVVPRQHLIPGNEAVHATLA
eukprot:361539-Chlamydomonas_euryale.AAC.4